MSTQTAPGLSESGRIHVATDVDSRIAIDLFSVELAHGDEMRAWLGVPSNIESWNALYDSCLWSNPFLSSQFFNAWASCYDDISDPLLAIGKSTNGAIVAIMPLARTKGRITGAGSHQAEYQGWLSDTSLAARFFQETLRRITRAFPLDRLFFKYLPPKLPQNILEGIFKSNPSVIAHSDVRPVLRLDIDEIRKTLAKKATKSKLNRLKRIGELAFKQLSSAAELEQYFDQIIDLYDFRQGAMNDTLPFREDVRKRPFHLEWMKRAPEQFAVTLMLLDDKVISVFIGIAKGNEAHLAITAHSPCHAQHSPGKLHLYQAALLLAQVGYGLLDLTPGGEWKERFATDHDRVHGLTAWPTANAARLAAAREQTSHLARTFLRSVGLPPARLRRGLYALRKATPLRVARRVGRLMPKRIEFRLYKLRPSEFESGNQDDSRASVNALADLCSFEPIYDWQSRQAFLFESMNRLEAGNRCYTVCADGKLLHAGWLAPSQAESHFSEVNQRFRYPEPGAALYDFFTAPAARRRGYYQRTMCQMLMDLKHESSTFVTYISVLADNVASRRAIEKIGFSYFCSLYRSRVLWREKHELFLVASDQPHEKNT